MPPPLIDAHARLTLFRHAVISVAKYFRLLTIPDNLRVQPSQLIFPLAQLCGTHCRSLRVFKLYYNQCRTGNTKVSSSSVHLNSKQ